MSSDMETGSLVDPQKPDYEYEYESDYDSVSIHSRISHNVQNRKRDTHDPNVVSSPLLPKVYTVTKYVNGKRARIKLYETRPSVNSRIINAVTGRPYYVDDDDKCKYVVGSRQEHDLFSVKMLSGIGQNRALFFYDSPEQYERHQFIKVNENIKIKWADKNQTYRKTIARYNTQ